MGAFAEADELDRDAEVALDGDDDATLGGAVELGQDDAGDADGVGELAGLGEAVLAGGGMDAVVFYYVAGDEDDAAKIHCPVLFHLAEIDEFDPPEFYEGFVTALRSAGTEVEVHAWPGTEHSFANSDVALYAPAQAEQAWSATVEFLRDRLTGARPTGG